MTAPTTYDFAINAWTPQTLPMAHLAEYLKHLAPVFGFEAQVHFIQMRKGSAVAEVHVEELVAPKVQARLKLVATGEAPEDALRSMRAINVMLTSDKASAVLRPKRGPKIVKFPGCKATHTEELTVYEAGSLRGTVIRVGGKDETVPLLLQDSDGSTYSCTTSRAIARELAHHLFDETVQVHGNAKWRRNPERLWELDSFKVQSWERLSPMPLRDAVDALRAIDGSLWNGFADPQDELKKLRANSVFLAFE